MKWDDALDVWGVHGVGGVKLPKTFIDECAGPLKRTGEFHSSYNLLIADQDIFQRTIKRWETILKP